MTASAAPLDTVRSVATPEGCELRLRVAGPAARARAFMIDALIRLLIFVCAVVVLRYFGALGQGLVILTYFVLGWFYNIAFEALNDGATPGKRLCKLAVLREDGTPAGWDAAFIRNTLRFVDALPVGYAFGLIAMGCNADNKRLGDISAGTVVVYRPDAGQSAVIDDYSEAEPPPFSLTPSERHALIEYRRRCATLTRERAEELAELAFPLTRGLSPPQGRQKLFRIANFLMGREASAARKTD
ncbi:MULTISPECIES: RDD family protein [Methylocaldum]|jgi:uncharacterized RDD family membrane protein YckC|uniref:RDD family protein n=1 Tax=unclassified Methylocaldum TaxID=2622260 RepID=UPI00098A22FB|nr:RDD family protein [Methylocaldum sp. 14B]